MSFFDKSQAQSLLYNYPAGLLFQAMCAAVQTVSGFRVVMANPQTLSIQISKSMSLLTWGEDIYVQFVPVNQSQTNLQIVSKSKLGTEIAANSKNRKNIEALLQALQTQLMNLYQQPPQPYMA